MIYSSKFCKQFFFFNFRKSECGEAIFQFRSNSILDILASIKKNIFLAISLRNEKKTAPCPPVKRTSQTENPFRHSVPSSGHGRNKSLSSSEQGIRDLLESPSKHAEKRFRLMSESSEASSKSEENMLDTKTEVTEEEQKTITNTTTNQNNISKFDSDLEPVENKSAKDILSEPIETKSNSANTESNYNRIDFKQPSDASHPAATIISTITVAKPGYQTSVLLDEKGYSHVNLNSVKVQSDGDKMRSLSNDSNQSAISCRSASSGSRDSGILNQVQEKQQNEPNTNTETSHRSTNSFDSAVSTTSVVENTESTVLDAKPSKLSVEIHEVEVTLSEKAVQNDTSGDGCIYQDVSFEEPKSECINKARSKLRKSNSTGYFQTEENPYEELDKYRKCKKDLVKHLGMDPKIDPSSVPPSLPDRPMSHKMKRKFGANSEKKIFTLPFAKHRSKKNREKAMSSTSSESDSENGSIKRRDDLSCIKVWPLGDMSIADNNEFYQPVAIERFLNDKDANSLEIKRERSCSLNLNRVSDIKRPSVSSVNVDLRVSSRVKHGRNASLNADLTHDSDLNASDIHPKLFQQKNSSKPDAKKTDANSPVSQVQFSLSPTSSLDNEMTVDEDSDDNETEPIYAEVLPVGPKRQEIEEPFPDLDEWKPQNMSDFQTNELDDTNFENDGEVVVDLFNIGFVTKNEPNEIAETKVPNTGILIDLFDTETSNEVNRPRTKSAVDIFNATNSALMENSGQSAVKAENIKADLNQAFIDIFSLGAATPMQQSSTEFWSQPTNHESSSVGGSLANTNENWADFSQFEAAQRESTTTTSDSIYMDMSNYKNESIYVMPSEAREQH